MIRFAFVFLLGLVSACGGGSTSNKRVFTQQGVYDECMKWCYHRFQCYQDVCSEDYPGSASSFQVSVLANDCIQTYCETENYAKDKVDQQDYFDCTMMKSCREVTTGACGDVATCTKDPNSTPYLPGTHTKAPPKH